MNNQKLLIVSIFIVVFMFHNLGIKAQNHDNNFFIKKTLDGVIDDIYRVKFFTDSTSLELIKLGKNNSVVKGVHSMSDSAGQLIYYIDEASFYDTSHHFILNGDSLEREVDSLLTNKINAYYLIDYDIQSIPFPGKLDQYLVFYSYFYRTNLDTYNSTLFYSRIDMAQNNGKGIVVERNVKMSDQNHFNTSLVKHANGTDWWLLAPIYASNKIDIYLIDSMGIKPYNTINSGSVPDSFYYNIAVNSGAESHGNTTCSPSGRYFATSYANGDIRFYTFDRCNGSAACIGALSNYYKGKRANAGLGFTSVVFDDVQETALIKNAYEYISYNLNTQSTTKINNSFYAMFLDRNKYGNSLIQYREDIIYSTGDRIEYLPKINSIYGLNQYEHDQSEPSGFLRLQKFPNYRLAKQEGIHVADCSKGLDGIVFDKAEKFTLFNKNYFVALRKIIK